jgi:hypothetical protein
MVATGVAVTSEITKALIGLPTPRVPPLQQALFIGGENARPGIGVPFTLGEDWGLQRAHDRHTTDAEWLGHHAIRPPLAVQRPHLCIGGEPPRPALRRPGLGLRRRRTRRDWDGGLAIGLDDGCTTPRVTHGFQRLPVRAEDLVEGFGEVLQEMKAVGDLRGLRCTRAGPIPLDFQAISGDHCATGMRTSPVGQRLRLTVVPQRHRPPPP